MVATVMAATAQQHSRQASGDMRAAAAGEIAADDCESCPSTSQIHPTILSRLADSQARRSVTRAANGNNSSSDASSSSLSSLNQTSNGSITNYPPTSHHPSHIITLVDSHQRRPQTISHKSSSSSSSSSAHSHHHYHGHNSLRSPNSSSLANLSGQLSLVAQLRKLPPTSCNQIGTLAPIRHDTNNNNTEQHYQVASNFKLPINLNPQPSLRQFNWTNSSSSSSGGGSSTNSSNPSMVTRTLLPSTRNENVHQSIKLHRKSLLAQQRAAAAAAVGAQQDSNHSNLCGRSNTTSLVPTYLRRPTNSTATTSVREALVSSGNSLSSRGSGSSRRAGSQRPTTNLQPVAPPAVTNSRVRQGALYARRQYPNPNNTTTTNTTANNCNSTTSAIRTVGGRVGNSDSRFLINNHQLLRSTESSQSLVQLNSGKYQSLTNCSKQPIGQKQQTISKASSRFSLNSSTSSLSLVVVKRAKPSPPQVKSIKFNNNNNNLQHRSKSPTPIRSRNSASHHHNHHHQFINYRHQEQVKQATVNGRQVRRGASGFGSSIASSSHLYLSTATSSSSSSSNSSITNSFNRTAAVAPPTTEAETRANTTRRNNKNQIQLQQQREEDETTANIIKYKQRVNDINVDNLINGNNDNTIDENIKSTSTTRNNQLEEQILVSNARSGCCLVLSPRATTSTTTLERRSATNHSKLPVINNNNNNNRLSRGGQPELGSRKASIGDNSGGSGKSNKIMISDGSSSQQKTHNSICVGSDQPATIIESNIMLKERQPIDSQGTDCSRNDFLNNNNIDNNSQLQEKRENSPNIMMNDKSPLGLHRSSQNIQAPNIMGLTKQAGTTKFHQVLGSDKTQPDSLEQHADENQPPDFSSIKQTTIGQHLIECEHESIAVDCSNDDDDYGDHKREAADANVKGSSAERDIVDDEEELNHNCCDTRSEAGSTDSRKTMDYQEEEDVERVAAGAAAQAATSSSIEPDSQPPITSTTITIGREVGVERYRSASVSMQRSDSLESNLESVEDQMVLGSPLVSPPPSELDVDVDGEDKDMIERTESSPSPPNSIQGDDLNKTSSTQTAATVKSPINIIMHPVDIPIRQEPIGDYYDLEARPFARGKFAQVKRCVSKISQKCFAAKCIKKRRRSTDIRHEILLEIEALKLSYHTNCIVKLYEVFETQTEMILVLEMANGGELQRVLDDEEAIAEKLVKQMVRQILDGLILLHDSNIAHLDIKPQNLLLTETFPSGDIKLCDFGISRRITKDCEIREICGTPDYVAPEILRYDPISLATDMWSLGVLTYVLLSGYSPFGSDSKQQTFCNITQAKLDFPNDIFDKISQDAIDFMQKLIIREPSDRLTSRQARVHPWLVSN